MKSQGSVTGDRRAQSATLLLVLIGFGSSANAAWMLLSPDSWFHRLPAAVADFGPYNVHFVRDVGIAYLSVGVGLLWGE